MNSPGRLAIRPISTACFMETCASHPMTPISARMSLDVRARGQM
jgi:hypothetical protein